MSDGDVQCRRAQQTHQDQCEVAAALASIGHRRDYETSGRNAVLFFGYILSIVPGIVLHIAFNGERESISADLDLALTAAVARCGISIGPPGATQSM